MTRIALTMDKEIAARIVADYGRVLEEAAESVVLPESLLPHKKETIREAIRVQLSLLGPQNKAWRDSLIVGYGLLGTFVSERQAKVVQRRDEVLNKMLDTGDTTRIRLNVELMKAASEIQQKALAEQSALMEEAKRIAFRGGFPAPIELLDQKPGIIPQVSCPDSEKLEPVLSPAPAAKAVVNMWSLRIIGAITLFVMLLNVGTCVYYGWMK